MSQNNCPDISPPADTKVHFFTATAFVRDARIYDHIRPIRLTSRDRGIRVSLDSGYILIERRWSTVKT